MKTSSARKTRPHSDNRISVPPISPGYFIKFEDKPQLTPAYVMLKYQFYCVLTSRKGRITCWLGTGSVTSECSDCDPERFDFDSVGFRTETLFDRESLCESERHSFCSRIRSCCNRNMCVWFVLGISMGFWGPLYTGVERSHPRSVNERA